MDWWCNVEHGREIAYVDLCCGIKLGRVTARAHEFLFLRGVYMDRGIQNKGSQVAKREQSWCPALTIIQREREKTKRERDRALGRKCNNK